MNTNTQTDEDLIEAYYNDPPPCCYYSFEELRDKYYSRLEAFFSRCSGQRQVAHDLADEVFLKVGQTKGKESKYDRSKGNFSGWLFKIA